MSENPGQKQKTERRLVVTLAEHLARSGGTEPEWVRVAVLGAERRSDGAMRYELADPLLERQGDVASATLPPRTTTELTRLHRNDGPWRLLVGHELELLLRTTTDDAGSATEIVDVDDGWLEAWQRSAHRERLSVLAQLGAVCDQRGQEILHLPRVVDVLHGAGPSWPDARARLAALSAASDLVVREILAVEGSSGWARVARYLERRITGGTSRPDIVLILADDTEAMHFVDDLETALMASAVQVPIVLGAPRLPGGSLLHEVVFSSSDGPISGVAELERLVEEGHAVERRARRIRDYVRRAGRDARV